MNLKCMINGKISGVFLSSSNDNNRLLQGNTITEDYSETLDSGSIILSDVPKMVDLDPYDDVYIWNCDAMPTFDGVNKENVLIQGLGTFVNREELEKQFFLLSVPNWVKIRVALKDSGNTSEITFYNEPNNITMKMFKYSVSQYRLEITKIINNQEQHYAINNFTSEGFEANVWYDITDLEDIIQLEGKPNLVFYEKFIAGDNRKLLVSVSEKMLYKHFLVDKFSEERNLLNQNNYNYKIELFSETKGLENIVLPNIKITQPLDVSKRLTTLQYMLRYLELYSPKIKIKTFSSWNYEPKYKLSMEMKEMFENCYCQEFSLNSPTLRDLFAKLMITTDSIPIVKDNVIYPLRLSKTTGVFDLARENKSFIQMQKTSDGYATRFRTNYNNALSPNPTCHRVEQLGFRNSDDAIMTIDNMRLETGFPIYKLNKVYMCYHKKIEVYFYDATNDTMQTMYMYFLCKQDMTKLCVLNNERQVLYKDTRVASKKTDLVDFMKDNYYFTVGYSIGSNQITGFGERFSYIKSFGLSTWNETECVVRNIMNNLDRLNPFGIDGEMGIKSKIIAQTGKTPYDIKVKSEEPSGFGIHQSGTGSDTIPSIFLDDDMCKTLNFCEDKLNNVAHYNYTAGGGVKVLQDMYEGTTKVVNAILTWTGKQIMGAIQGDSLLVKGLTFMVDYEGFYNGAIMTDKEVLKNPVMKTDNQSDSMPYLDLDGVARERKIQKMGNKSYTITARYDSWDEVQDIGTTFTVDTNDENLEDEEEIIIYHRDISIYDNKIDVTYFGQESFVLKNFYTSVFAKQRLFNVLDYGNSLTRAENVKDIIFASKDKLYNILSNFSISSYDSFKINDYLNFYQPTDKVDNKKIDKAIMCFGDKLPYFADINTFTCGNSVCFNMRMFDNITMGTSLDPTHLSGKMLGNISETDDNNYKGTTQQLCTIYGDYQTGRVENMAFAFASSKNVDNELLLTKQFDQNGNIVNNNTTFNYDDVYQTLLLDGYSVGVPKPDYTVDNASVKVISWQLEKLYYPLITIPFDSINITSNFPAKIKNVYYKTIHKDANEIIDMTFQTQLMVDKKYRKDILFSDLALKLSDLVGNISKNNISTMPQNITFVPFQLRRRVFVANENKPFTSLQGFMVKAPKIAMDVIVNARRSLSVNFVLQINSLKSDRFQGQNNKNRIIKWSISTESIYFVDRELVRLNCHSISVTYLKASTNEEITITNENTFIYLHNISPLYIDDDEKEDYLYFTNIEIINAPDEELSDTRYIPFLSNYWKEGKDPYSSIEPEILETTIVENNVVTTIQLEPSDINGANTAFWGYIAEDHTISPTTTSFTGDFEVVDGDFVSYIYNYYQKIEGGDDICRIGVDRTKELMQIDWQSYERLDPDTQFYLTSGLSVFRDIDYSTNYYTSWNIGTYYAQYTPAFENTMFSVGGTEKLDLTLIDKKMSNISGDLELLKANNAYIDCNEVFSISSIEDGHGTSNYMSKLRIDLSKIPNLNKYQSIQEWFYNVNSKAFEFVCGFNISQEDKDNYALYLQDNTKGSRYIDVYLSLMGDLDLQVYNSKGIVVGKVANKLKTSNDVELFNE